MQLDLNLVIQIFTLSKGKLNQEFRPLKCQPNNDFGWEKMKFPPIQSVWHR